MKTFLIVLLLPFCGVAFEYGPPPFPAPAPKTMYDSGGWELVTLDGKLAYRNADGRFISAAQHDSPTQKAATGPNAPPVIVDEPARAEIVTLAPKHTVVAEAKKIAKAAVADFKAMPDKVESKISDILPPKPKAAKLKFDASLDSPSFVESLQKIEDEKSAQSGIMVGTEKKPVIVERKPTSGQLQAMRDFHLSYPPRLVALDGTVTEGIAVSTPCGECLNGQCQYKSQEPYVECEKCRLRQR